MEYYFKTQEIRLNALGEMHQDVGACYNNLGVFNAMKGDLDQSLEYFSKSLKIKSIAGEAAFKENANRYAIIHLATHALVDDAYPMNSRLLFTVQDQDSVSDQGREQGEDGDLHAWELYNMQLRAQMAVLSACNTGYGKLRRGEGVMSLGRAFAFAGVPSIVMSLWPASDKSTAGIMESFYASLSEGVSKEAALQAAKLKYLENADEITAHPYFWAGFVAQGDMRPLKLRSDMPWWGWVLLGLGLAGTGGFFLMKRRRSSWIFLANQGSGFSFREQGFCVEKRDCHLAFESRWFCVY
jgi:LPXTG-motif cell wall-anchored protein